MQQKHLLGNDLPHLIENPENIRDKIGKDFDLKSFFSPEKIKKAHNLISDTYGVFYAEIISLVQEAADYCQIMGHNQEENQRYVSLIAERAFSIKGKSETIGNNIGFVIAKSLYEYTDALNEVSLGKLLVIRKHLNLLESNFSNKNQNMPSEAVILNHLNLLIEKINKD